MDALDIFPSLRVHLLLFGLFFLEDILEIMYLNFRLALIVDDSRLILRTIFCFSFTFKCVCSLFFGAKAFF